MLAGAAAVVRLVGALHVMLRTLLRGRLSREAATGAGLRGCAVQRDVTHRPVKATGQGVSIGQVRRVGSGPDVARVAFARRGAYG